MRKDLSFILFADRYAMKKRSMEVGDIGVISRGGITSVVDIQEINGNKISIKYSDGEIESVNKQDIDVLSETHPDEMFMRVAEWNAQAEKPDHKKPWTRLFYEQLKEMKFVPAGRILKGARKPGSQKKDLTPYNCYVIPSPVDSRGGIMESATKLVEIMSRGGGVGVNLSTLRYKRANVRKVDGRSSGSVSWGSLFSFLTGLIEQAGSRRGALMIILNVWHPDILDFINSKREAGRITNANISVGITDDFMEAVKNDDDWDLIFPDTTDPYYDQVWDGDINKWIESGREYNVVQTVKARQLWDSIAESAWASAEPGIFFIDRYNKMSNSWYYSPIIATNPCGEQGLPAWGVCNLAAINLSKFVSNGEILWEELSDTVQIVVRFLDNVVDLANYFFEENKNQQLGDRRLGLGTMGLADMLLKLKIRYGSKKSEELIDKIYKYICETAYLYSCSLAEERGTFPYFDKDSFLKSGFVQSLDQSIRDRIAEVGIRNVTITTQAPTGTTGTFANTSTGIEPNYLWEYTRKGRMGQVEMKVPVYQEWVEDNPGEDLPDYFVTAMDLTPEEHVRIQGVIQRWIDSSISKTCNLPETASVADVKKIYELMYESGCKGGTVYRDNSRSEQVLNKKTVPPSSFEWRSRPGVLGGQTWSKDTPIGKLYLTLNEDNDGPFEAFINVGRAGSDVAADAEGIGRLVSLILRLPGPMTPEDRLKAVAGQLKGIGSGRSHGFGKNRVTSLPDAIGKILDRGKEDALGLPDKGEKVIGDFCPECGNMSYVRMEQCKKCINCGHSEC